MIKLKLPGKASSPTDEVPPQSARQTPSSAPPAQAPKKLKLNFSQPPTPIEQTGDSGAQLPNPGSTAEKKKKPAQKKQDGQPKGKKRAANDDTMSPAAKRPAGEAPSRKVSLKISNLKAREGGAAAPPKPKLSLQPLRKNSVVPKLVDIRARGKAPPRQNGVGYDSEDSDTEKDPAIQQAVVLRMEDGEDAEYLRKAIADGKIGPHPSQGDAEVSIKFLEKNLRRAVIKIRGRLYGAVLVDLPCIVESMKSFDKKGWWKVADIAQMLLVLGRCNTEEGAKTMPLPREVNKTNFQYAHGLTSPMHWVRKRRFRKRLNYNEILNVEEEVERLIKADEQWEAEGGTVKHVDNQNRLEQQAPQEEFDDEEDAEGEAVETVEMGGTATGQEYEDDDDEEDDDDLAAQMQAEFDADAADEEAVMVPAGTVSDIIMHSPAPIVDQAASMSAVENAMEDATPMGTPAGGAGMETQDEDDESDEDESDEDEDDDPDTFDEDAAARAAERAQQMEEVADLEREVDRARLKAQSQTNQLLKQREMQKLAALEEDLRLKKSSFGLLADDEE